MKKFLAVLLGVTLVMSAVGCSSSTSTDSDESTTVETTTESTEVAEAKEVIVWAWDQNIAVIEYAEEVYNATYPDNPITVTIQSVTDTEDKLSTFFAAGIGDDLPDMVLMDNETIQSFIIQFSDSFMNLTDEGYGQYEDCFSAAQWDVLSGDDGIYAFPFDIAPLMMAVNTSILEEAGVDPDSITTWDDIVAVSDDIVDAGYSVTTRFYNREIIGMMQSAGVGIFDEDGNIDVLNPETVSVVETVMALYESGAINVLDDGAGYDEGTTAMNLQPAWLIGENIGVKDAIDGEVILISMPMMADEDGYTASANDGGSSFVILEASEVKDEAYLLGEIISTDLGAQEVALEQGLMPGYLPAADLDVMNESISFYSDQTIWSMLSEAAADTPAISVNEDYSLAKEIFNNVVVDSLMAGTVESAEDILQECADMLAEQTGRSINEY